jgi:hypothetical protein
MAIGKQNLRAHTKLEKIWLAGSRHEPLFATLVRAQFALTIAGGNQMVTTTSARA